MKAGRGAVNVFAELGLPNPEERQLKARLMYVFNEAVARSGLTQVEAAERVGLDQADISRISYGQGSRYSVERLMIIIAKFGLDIRIIQRHDKNGNIVVEVKELS